jgi:DNA-binding transcriptional regulator YdaS (Cro superfamily)
MSPITSYLSSAGITQLEFAKRIGVSQSMVYQMIVGIRPVSEKTCVRIETATNGAVSRRDLRPNDWAEIWPELATQQEAEHA